jgi:DNA-binding beta-propeller fold protein YncE
MRCRGGRFPAAVTCVRVSARVGNPEFAPMRRVVPDNARGLSSVFKPVAAVVAITTAAVLTASCATPTATPAAPASQTPAAKLNITTQKSIALPGVGGHGDEVVVDPGAHSAYVAQSPDNNLVVINTTANSVAAVVPQIASGNGIAFSDSYVFVAQADAGAVAVIAKPSWQVIATVPSGGKTPDAIYYDPRENSIFVTNDDSNNMEQFSATAPFAIEGTLNLDPAQAKTGPDLGTYASADDKIYQSDDNNVDVIDAKTRTIQKVFTPLSADATTKDIYYDQAHHLLWVGTSDPKVLAIDPDTGKVVYTVKTASGMDQLAADTDDGLLFLGESKAGVMGVVDLATHANIADVKTESGFHTEGYLPSAHLAYAYLNQSNKIEIDNVSKAQPWR